MNIVKAGKEMESLRIRLIEYIFTSVTDTADEGIFFTWPDFNNLSLEEMRGLPIITTSRKGVCIRNFYVIGVAVSVNSGMKIWAIDIPDRDINEIDPDDVNVEALLEICRRLDDDSSYKTCGSAIRYE